MSAIAVLGTGSDVGKSLIAAGLCRLLADKGVNVAPFKAQNMSNNSYVAGDGGEVGRAQFVQATAARLETSVHHNPILLKPSSEQHSQVIVRGQATTTQDAATYFKDTSKLRTIAFESLERLKAQHHAVVLEGAGSCAEVNLRSRDFVNFDAAHAAEAEVVLTADINRGGVFAQLLGTLQLISTEDRARVKGLLVNQFRGDLRLFDDGVRYLEQHSGLPVLGVVPYLHDLQIDAEDALPPNVELDPLPTSGDHDGAPVPRVAVLFLPRISNFTDFDPLVNCPAVMVHYLRRVRSLSSYDCVLIPGTKSTLAALSWLRKSGWAGELNRYAAAGGKLFGICGGYQLLGRRIQDSEGADGTLSEGVGLGLLDANTILRRPKVVRRCSGETREGVPVSGYEIHHGRTLSIHPPLLELLEGPDGAYTEHVWGAYPHGLFDSPAFLTHFLRWLSPASPPADPHPTRLEFLNQELDRWAAHLQQHLDLTHLSAFT